MEESGEWAEKKVERLSPASAEHLNFYKRTRPTKDSRELSSPKKTGETFSKAKEQHHSPKKTDSQAQEATLSGNRVSQIHTRTQSTSPRTSPQTEQQVALALQCVEQQQGPQRRLKDSPSRESLTHEKKNGKGGTIEIRRYTQAREMERRAERFRPESFKRREMGESLHHRTSPHLVRESENGTGTDSGRRDANGKGKSPTGDRSISKEAIGKQESLLSPKDKCSRKGSVVSPKEAKGRHMDGRNKDLVASINSIPGSPQSPEGPISPGPWKVPSSAKILSRAEVLRGPL